MTSGNFASRRCNKQYEQERHTNRRGMRKSCLCWFCFSLSAFNSSAVIIAMLRSDDMNLTLSRSKNNYSVSKAKTRNFFKQGRFVPAWNSVPAISAVERNSSSVFCSVTDWRLSRFQSIPSFKSFEWSYKHNRKWHLLKGQDCAMCHVIIFWSRATNVERKQDARISRWASILG